MNSHPSSPSRPDRIPSCLSESHCAPPGPGDVKAPKSCHSQQERRENPSRTSRSYTSVRKRSPPRRRLSVCVSRNRGNMAAVRASTSRTVGLLGHRGAVRHWAPVC
ncbi:hypothetical protein E2C01_055058 [Portunus trituberculatus]|uniref:Uncharacterized protein n=1 Tax=Portunus trituberculatus TaxID=210409 RepID=A0A5B7GTS9_PORTR|nr:hypothetical protein [Portunus trituberculatus]